jgi:hypothetical protein
MKRLHSWAGVDIDDPATTFPGNRFQLSIYINYEVYAPNPVHTTLIILAFILCLGPLRKRWLSDNPDLTLYVSMVAASGLLFCILLKWQEWITRLQVPFFALAAAPVAIAIHRFLGGRGAVFWSALMGLTAFPLVLVSYMRPVIPMSFYIHTQPKSILTANRWDIMFANRPDFLEVLVKGIDYLGSRGVTNLGLIIADSTYDYPVFGLVEERIGQHVRIEHVCVTNGTGDSALEPDWAILYERESPERIECANGTFVKEQSFVKPSWDRGANDGVHVYRRVQPDIR